MRVLFWTFDLIAIRTYSRLSPAVYVARNFSLMIFKAGTKDETTLALAD
jgi:hypothetical protein